MKTSVIHVYTARVPHYLHKHDLYLQANTTIGLPIG